MYVDYLHLWLFYLIARCSHCSKWPPLSQRVVADYMRMTLSNKRKEENEDTRSAILYIASALFRINVCYTCSRGEFFNTPRSSDANLFWTYILSRHDILGNNIILEQSISDVQGL